MRTVKLITYGLFIVCFSLVLLTSTVRLGVNSVHLYQHGFDKYQASQATGLDERQLEEIAERLVAYFNSKVETPQIMIVKESQPSLRAEGEAISFRHRDCRPPSLERPVRSYGGPCSAFLARI